MGLNPKKTVTVDRVADTNAIECVWPPGVGIPVVRLQAYNPDVGSEPRAHVKLSPCRECGWDDPCAVTGRLNSSRMEPRAPYGALGSRDEFGANSVPSDVNPIAEAL